MLKNITFSAEEALIKEARLRAARSNKTLNELFREWLAPYVSKPEAEEQYLRLMDSFSNVDAGYKFSRDELNERR